MRRFEYYFQNLDDSRYKCVPRPQTTVGSQKMQFLVISGAYIFGTFTAKANITIQRHEIPYRLSDDFKNAWPEVKLRCHFNAKICFLRRLHWMRLRTWRSNTTAWKRKKTDLQCQRQKCSPDFAFWRYKTYAIIRQLRCINSNKCPCIYSAYSHAVRRRGITLKRIRCVIGYSVTGF